MKGCVQWNSVYSNNVSSPTGLKHGTARSVGPGLTHSATESPDSFLKLNNLRAKYENSWNLQTI